MKNTYSVVRSPSRTWGWVVVSGETGRIIEEGFMTRHEAFSYIYRYFA